MYLFFEEDGSFKVGTVLSQTGSAYQVELLTGRRTKVKGGHVFFEFSSPAASEVMEAAERVAEEMDPQFLWEVAPEEEFQFTDLADEYFGESADVVQRVATLLALHGHPVYFHRKGRGNYRKAPEQILKVALQALEKKRLAEEQKKAWVRQMVDEKVVPKEIASQAINLLVNPDKNGMLWKALSDAASESRMTPLRLLLSLGAILTPPRRKSMMPRALNMWTISFCALAFILPRQVLELIATVTSIRLRAQGSLRFTRPALRRPCCRRTGLKNFRSMKGGPCLASRFTL